MAFYLQKKFGGYGVKYAFKPFDARQSQLRNNGRNSETVGGQ